MDLLANLDARLLNNLIVSVILIVTVLILRYVVIRGIRKVQWRIDQKRRILVNIRNASLVIIGLGLFLVWSTELKTFAVSIVAIAAAVVIATKELLMCFFGGVLRLSNQMFDIGDRIEVKGIRGDVTDHSFMTTTLFEIGPGKDFHQFTGRVVTIPNSIFLTESLVNETKSGRFVLHVFKVTRNRAEDVKEVYERLLTAANTICSPYISEALQQFERMGRREGLSVPDLEPRVSLAFSSQDAVDYLVRVPVATNLKGRIEQDILKHFAGISQA